MQHCIIFAFSEHTWLMMFTKRAKKAEASYMGRCTIIFLTAVLYFDYKMMRLGFIMAPRQCRLSSKWHFRFLEAWGSFLTETAFWWISKTGIKGYERWADRNNTEWYCYVVLKIDTAGIFSAKMTCKESYFILAYFFMVRRWLVEWIAKWNFLPFIYYHQCISTPPLPSRLQEPCVAYWRHMMIYSRYFSDGYFSARPMPRVFTSQKPATVDSNTIPFNSADTVEFTRRYRVVFKILMLITRRYALRFYVASTWAILPLSAHMPDTNVCHHWWNGRYVIFWHIWEGYYRLRRHDSSARYKEADDDVLKMLYLKDIISKRRDDDEIFAGASSHGAHALHQAEIIDEVTNCEYFWLMWYYHVLLLARARWINGGIPPLSLRFSDAAHHHYY